MDRSVDQLHADDRQSLTTLTTENLISTTESWQDSPAKTGHADKLTTTDQCVAKRIQERSTESLTTETDDLRATLIGVPRLQIDDLIYPHHRCRLEESTRFCALFDVENTGSVPINWTSTQTKFIGTDKYTYKRSHVSLDPSKLGPGCHPSHVEIEPNSRARIITLVEKLPPSTGVSQVTHRVKFHGRLASQRLTYSL